MTERMFPVLRPWIPNDQRRKSVPWSWLAPHEEWAVRNHQQSLELLARRGGLAPSEMRAIVSHEHWNKAHVAGADEWLEQQLGSLGGPAPKEGT